MDSGGPPDDWIPPNAKFVIRDTDGDYYWEGEWHHWSAGIFTEDEAANVLKLWPKAVKVRVA
jgi:hypothetical protein